jgi:hypothetical protein
MNYLKNNNLPQIKAVDLIVEVEGEKLTAPANYTSIDILSFEKRTMTDRLIIF